MPGGKRSFDLALWQDLKPLHCISLYCNSWMSYSRAEISEFEEKIGKSRATLFRWAKQGCDLRTERSVQEWIERNRLRETNIAKSRRRRGFTQKVSSNVP